MTGVTASVNPSTYSGACPANFNFSANITTNGAGTVTYRWERSDGGLGSTQSINFTGAGSQTVTTGGNPGITGAGWHAVHILTPNDMASNKAGFTNNCGAPAVFAVTSVTAISVSPNAYSGACVSMPPLTLTGTITTNGAGTVTYYWPCNILSGSCSGAQNLTFTGAGTQTVTYTYQYSPCLGGARWFRIHINTPNSMDSNQVWFTDNSY